MNSPILYGTLSIIKFDDKFLLIKRNKEPYKNYWGLIGGKLEAGETIEESTLREVMEETSLNVKFKSVKAFLNEVIYDENKKPAMHFILSISEVISETSDFTVSSEGNLKWFTIDEIHQFKDRIIPSDYLITLNVHKKNEIIHFEAKIDDKYNLIYFK